MQDRLKQNDAKSERVFQNSLLLFYVIDICIFLLREIESIYYFKNCVIYTGHLRISFTLNDRVYYLK
jgi:hypothetical protein